ncbi:rho-GTPase-activating protein Rgd2p [[Candida] jaroonii]|uniref:Rho-GTPase-activating protein Rgd2p n=1 Tax=[Candida] jaroonii TaxID=467808 RepID=A0ACA9Y647_9ASCO|nr:rho-GTPase-activating protein Rgd2p [[Candida] jaroonii]
MSFTDSFWSIDYNQGIRVLFDQLYQGIKENESFIDLFKKRSESEFIYGNQLNSISTKSNSDYISSIRTAFDKINENFEDEGNYHIVLSENINLKVVEPFSKWCHDHKERIEYSDNILIEKYKYFKKYKTSVEKIQKKYFNKCRILEEFKNNFDEEDLNESMRTVNVEEEEDFDEEIYQIGDLKLSEKNFKKLLTDLINNIEIKDHKVSILGTYSNVSNGSNITHWLLNNVEELDKDISKIERFGQDLIDNDYLRLIGTINNNKNFINSSQYYYQWKPKIFEFIGFNAIKDDLTRSNSTISSNMMKNQFSDYFEDMKQVIGVNNVDLNDKSQYLKISQEVNGLDQQYYQAVEELDKIRCEFEELIMDHLTFMEKCEFDRLKAIKKVLFDFLKIFNAQDKKKFLNELSVLEETINPVNDLKFLIENFKVGKFKPNVVLYDNYYNSNINQTFGVDLSIKSRLDKKIVPILVQCILSHLDKVYPDLINDEERINLWIKPVQLNNIHSLRFKLNHLSNPQDINEILNQQHPMIITNLLKLYFLELPDSLILHNSYEIIKSLYLNYPINTNDDLDESRINGLQNVLSDLPKCNLATLDALLTHLNRLIQIIGKKDHELAVDFRNKLSKEFSSIIILPKNNDHIFVDNFQYHFILDLFDNKDVIFKQLRRNNSSHEDGSLRIKKKRSTLDKELPNPKTPSKPRDSEMKTPRPKDSEKTPRPSEFKSSKSEPLPKTPKPETLPKTPKQETSTPKPDSQSPGLRRSTSPNKKSLNSCIEKNNSSSSIVSSKPVKKDIIYDFSDLQQPKFAPSLGRKSSVKDLASKFESESPSPTPKSSASSTKSFS